MAPEAERPDRDAWPGKVIVWESIGCGWMLQGLSMPVSYNGITCIRLTLQLKGMSTVSQIVVNIAPSQMYTRSRNRLEA